MAIWLFLTFLALPFVEIALFIEVGGAIGVVATLGLVILSAVVGMALVRRQGLQTLGRLRQDLEAGRDPAKPLAHGALILVAGMLLLVPGFFTDLLGLILLIPAARGWVIRRGAARMTVRATSFAYPRRSRADSRVGETIDADYEVVAERPRSQNGSGWTRPQ